MLAARNRPSHAWPFSLRLAAWPTWLVLGGVMLLALALRLVPFLAAYPLHRDEALYGYWARLVASGQDPLLLTPWIDKPPLVLYLLAGSLRLFGAGAAAPDDLALRLPGMFASVLAVPALYGLARAAYGPRTGLLAAALLALSPFAILFAPTAFTDPWLMLWLVLAAWAALARRPFLAGLLAALAVASKQQGVFVIPLVLMLLEGGGRWTKDERRRTQGERGKTQDDRRTTRDDERRTQDERRRTHDAGRWTMDGGRTTRTPGILSGWAAQHSIRASASRRISSLVHRLSSTTAALFGFALIFGPLTYWDSLRWHNRPSFWDRSLSTYNPLTLAAPADWLPRLGQWAGQAGYWFGHPVVTAGVLVLAVIGVCLALWSRGFSRIGETFTVDALSAEAPISSRPDARLTVLLGAYALGYFAVHVLITFQPWDRYLLPLLPLVCLLAARGLAELLTRLRGPAPALALAAALTGAAALGVTGRLPVGSDHGAYTGLPQIVAQFRSQPADTIIYQHALGWHFDYYLFGAPQERRWFGSGWQLADVAARMARQGRPQWLVLPAFEQEWADAARLPLAARGLALAEAERIHRSDGSVSFVLYRIAPVQEAGR